MVSPAFNDHELPKGQLAVGRQRFCRPPLDRTGVRSFWHGASAAARGNFLLLDEAFPAVGYRTARYRSRSHSVNWTRYSSHSLRFSST